MQITELLSSKFTQQKNQTYSLQKNFFVQQQRKKSSLEW